MDWDVEQAYVEYIKAQMKSIPSLIKQDPERLNILMRAAESKKPIALPVIKGKASDELTQLITFIKANRLEKNYLLALNYEGILFLVDPDRKSEEGWCESSGFDFDCSKDNGFFYLFRQVPDDDPVRVLEENGIPIYKLDTLADVYDECNSEEEDEDAEDD